MTKFNWIPILEMDDEVTGAHTCYFAETGSRLPFVWLTQFKDGWHVETKFRLADCFMTLKVCKSLASAKRWATMNRIEFA